ncbi:MAG: 16S rRNA (adenine(1518)-N(6)/adenine(1519)-N(6))-dimethyltransferase RsmA [Granulosicoccaceae bacterium]
MPSLEHRARKRFGQNFLHDPSVIERIVRTINPKPDENLVEIGPGLGALTLPLLEAAGKMTAIELDRDLIPKIEAAAIGVGELSVRSMDALQMDLGQLAQELGGPIRVIGNLPYNISTPLLFHLYQYKDSISDMHFMLQKEVVQRMAAEAGDSHYGRLSVTTQYHCRVAQRFLVPPGSFNPPPKVDSAIVSLYPHHQPPFDCGSEKALATVVSSAFAQRRKTLRNSLRELMDEQAIESCGLEPTIRPERITLEKFAALSRHLHHISTQ